jgi:hypothetical protein
MEETMAWSISITAEGWNEIREKFESWTSKALIDAIADDKFEMVYEKAGQERAERAATAERKRLEDLPHDILVDRAYELSEANNTCDNGGWAYWIDREGCHKVQLGD